MLLAVLLVQFGPACGLGTASAMDNMQCCKTRCPVGSSRVPANCCRLSTSADKARSEFTNVAQPAFLNALSYPGLLTVRAVSELSTVPYRSPAPPPQRTPSELLCTRQL